MKAVDPVFDEFDDTAESTEAVEEYREPPPQLSPTELLLEELAVREVLAQVVERIPSLLVTFPRNTGQRVLRALGKTNKRLLERTARDGDGSTALGEWALAQAMYPSSVVNAERVAFQVLELLTPCIDAAEARRVIGEGEACFETCLWKDITECISARNTAVVREGLQATPNEYETARQMFATEAITS